MNVSLRIGAGFGLLVALMIGVLAYHTALVQELIATHQLSATTLQTARLSARVERQCDAVIKLTRKVSELERTGEPIPDQPLLPDYLEKLEAERAILENTLLELVALSVSDPERQAIVQLMHLWRAHLAALRPWSSAPTFAATTTDTSRSTNPNADAIRVDNVPGNATRASPESIATSALASLERLVDQASTLRAATDTEVADHLLASNKAVDQVGHINSVVLFASLGMSLAVGFVTVRSITRPLGRLIDATRAVASGRFFYQLDATRDDELGRVAAAFNTMTRRLEAFDRMKKDFVARVSHDLRTPLVAMQETNDVLLSQLVGPLNQRQERLVRLNRRGAKRLTTRIGHLLDLSRLEAGVLELDARRHDLAELVRETLEGVEGRLSHRHIDLRGQRPSHPLLAYCDGERLVEVIENVLDNAIKFSPTSGSLAVSLHSTTEIPAHLPQRWHRSLRPNSSGAYALITVADEGPGLIDADKARIFRSFFRASDHELPNTAGAGLGLAICHDLVRAHHGAIWVTDNPGGGCRFHILLPRTDRPTTTQAAAQTSTSGNSGGVRLQPAGGRVAGSQTP